MSEHNERNQKPGFTWVKSRESGRTFLCPIGSISNPEEASEVELCAACLDESENPQND
jgi:hypothetical protein